MVPSALAALALRKLVRTLPWLLAVSCIGGQSTDDVVRSDPSRSCIPTRDPVPELDELNAGVIERAQGSYQIAGRWGTPSPLLNYSPHDTDFRGRLEIARAEGPLVRQSGCGGDGIEVPLRVSLHSDDGALAETVDGKALLQESSTHATVDGSPPPFLLRVSAQFDLHALAGTFRAEESKDWRLGPGALAAEITPFGTRGSFFAPIVPRVMPKRGAALPATPASPDSGALLSWPVNEGCGDAAGGEGRALFPTDNAHSRALHAARERLAQESFPARYEDGTTTTISLRIDPPRSICNEGGLVRLHTTAHVRTADGRVDVSLAVFLDPSFALLHFNQLEEVAWAFPPDRLTERIGHISADLTGFAQVGVEAWFDRTPEPAGWFKLLGYRTGDCLLCDGEGGCRECSWDRRVTLLALYIGAEITRQQR